MSWVPRGCIAFRFAYRGGHVVRVHRGPPVSVCRPDAYDRAVTDEERVLRDFYDAFNTNELERAAAQFAPECEYAFIAFGPNRAQRTR